MILRTAIDGPADIYYGDLPMNRLVQTIAIDKNRPLTLYAGTERGVFQGRSTDQGVTWFWRPYNNGMPPADVRSSDLRSVRPEVWAA